MDYEKHNQAVHLISDPGSRIALPVRRPLLGWLVTVTFGDEMAASSQFRLVDAWSGHRVAVIAWSVAVALLPLHAHVSCAVSGRLGIVGIASAIIAGAAETWFAPYRRWSFAVFGAGGWALILLTGVFVH